MNANQAARNIRDAYDNARRISWHVDRAARDERVPEEVYDELLDELDHALDDLAAAIRHNTNGAVSFEEAERLARFKFDEIGELVDRLVV